MSRGLSRDARFRSLCCGDAARLLGWTQRLHSRQLRDSSSARPYIRGTVRANWRARPQLGQGGGVSRKGSLVVIAPIIVTPLQLFRRPRTDAGAWPLGRETDVAPTAGALIAVRSSLYRSRSAASCPLIISAIKSCSSRSSCMDSELARTG